jgi:hypothetical protein
MRSLELKLKGMKYDNPEQDGSVRKWNVSRKN